MTNQPDKPVVHIENLTFSDGSTVSLDPGTVLVIVGPNNVGKSRTITGLSDHLRDLPCGPVLSDVGLSKAPLSELRQWLTAYTAQVEDSNGSTTVSRIGFGCDQESLLSRWEITPNIGRRFASLFFWLGDGASRLQLAGEAPSFRVIDETPSGPVQSLFARPEVEQEVSDAVQEAFGTGVAISRHGGAAIPLLFTEPNKVTPVKDVPDETYYKRVGDIPKVESQGDGVKAFTGLMLALLTSNIPIVAIDEPEAFLHPPQARLFGRRLAGLAQPD